VGLSSGWGTSDLYQAPRKALSVFFVPPPDLLLEDPVVGRPTPAWATRWAMQSPDIHSVLVRAGFVPICKRSRIVRRRIHEGWYPPNIERQLWGTRVPGLLGESGFVSGVAGASPICTKPLGRRFRSFSCRHRTFPCSVRSPVGPRRPGPHGGLCGVVISILCKSGASLYGSGHGRVSFEGAFRRGGIQPTPTCTCRGRACRGSLASLGGPPE
jgi:hypothetical protein